MHVHCLSDYISHLYPVARLNTLDRHHVFCHTSSLARRDEHKSLTYQADIWLPLPPSLSLSGCSETDHSRVVLCWENQLLPTVDCLLYSLPSCVVSLFLPWGGDGRFLQGKSNNLSHHQTSLHVENIDVQNSRAPSRLFFCSLSGK